MTRVMPRSSTYAIIRIVMFLLLDLALTENTKYSGENTSFLNFHEERSTYNLNNYKQDKPFRKSNIMEIVGPRFSNNSQCFESKQIAESTNAKESQDVARSAHGKTLIDYNDPAIIKDPNCKNDQDSTNHVRVKRSEPATADIPHLRYKRAVLSDISRDKFKSSHRHRQRRRRNPRLPSPFPPYESGKNISDRTNIARVNDTDEKIEINEKDVINAALLTNNRTSDEQGGGNSVALPFVHTGKAQLRVRIEKIPTNESSFINSDSSTNNSVGKTSYLLVPKDGTIKTNFNIDVTRCSKLISNLDSSQTKEADKLILKNTLKKAEHGNNVSDQERCDNSGSTVLHAPCVDSHSVGSASQKIQDHRVESGRRKDRTNKISTELTDDDTRSRTKRNEEIKSKCHRSSDTSAGSKCLKDAARKSVRSTTGREKIRNGRTRGDRATRSIEEIKQLAEKLIVKINALQVYVSNHNETLYTTNSCFGKNARNIAIEEAPGTALQKQGVSGFKSEIMSSPEDRQHSHNEEGTMIEQRASRISRISGAPKYARGEYRTRRRSRRKWGRWMDWSSCSVTCGKGRQIRWRHCLRDCHDAETEMEEKTCQLPACPPGKFLGIF